MWTVGDATSVVRLLADGWKALRGERNITRLQARRLLRAFEVYGIARQQICRLLPHRLALPLKSFATAESLEAELTEGLLAWTSDFLVLRRGWLDGVDSQPHKVIEGYKREAAFGAFFADRIDLEPQANRSLHVWTPTLPRLGWSNSPGLLSMVYVEDTQGLDDDSVSRYWLLSQDWRLDHAPCVESMVKTVAIAHSMRILVVGRLVPDRMLRSLQRGRLFAPQVALKAGGLWYPADVQ